MKKRDGEYWIFTSFLLKTICILLEELMIDSALMMPAKLFGMVASRYEKIRSFFLFNCYKLARKDCEPLNDNDEIILNRLFSIDDNSDEYKDIKNSVLNFYRETVTVSYLKK